MADIYLGLSILTALAGVAFSTALRVTRSAPRYRCELLGVLVFLAMIWFTVNLWNQVRLSWLLPYSNLVVVGNWFVLAAGFLAGLAWRRVTGSRLRRIAFVSSLVIVGGYSLVHPLLGESPTCTDHWEGNICMQTSQFTCTPASAATLLRAHGIAATEAEMAELCLTRRGTTLTGLYRGLKRKTAGSDWDVEWFVCSTRELKDRVSQDGGPAILSVGIDANRPADPDYLREWGWVPGQRHSVVLFGFLGPQAAVIGDPAVGRELWSYPDLNRLWRGEGVRLVRKSPPAVAHDMIARRTSASTIGPEPR